MPPLAAILSWPIVGAILFNSLTLHTAILATMFGGYLLLPERIAFDLPLLPPLDKFSVPIFTALLIGLAFAGKAGPRARLKGLLPRHPVFWLCLAGLVGGAIMMSRTNGDVLVYGATVLPPVTLYDAFSFILATMVVLTALLIGRTFFARPEQHRMILYAFVIAGLCYSMLALFEMRMSPQLNNWIYGFFPHDFRQHYRAGGWRPIVFLAHGLFVGIFFATCIVAAAGLSRIDVKRRSALLFATIWLLATLVLCKTTGALAIALVVAACAFFLTPRMQIMAAAAIAMLFMIYPTMRATSVLTAANITPVLNVFGEERTRSARVRLENEDQVLSKLAERPAFGWGLWGRFRIYDSRGRKVTIVDGHWMAQIGQGGWTRLISEFTLLCAPIFLLLFASFKRGIEPETATLSLVLVANLFDLIPNTGITPITWLMVGALLGRVELGALRQATSEERESNSAPAGYRRALQAEPSLDSQAEGRGAPAYTRQRHSHRRGGHNAEKTET